MTGQVLLSSGAAPATPGAGVVTVYSKTDGKMYSKDSAGVETPLGGALGNRNILINAGFRINQRSYVSGAVLSAGAYGHDRFKAGASGGDYTFTQLNTNTQITIASGKSLIQVVEDKNVNETAYVLSWQGTAQARVGVNSATPSGTYASSPILITGQTAGTTMSVEFNAGTLGKVQLEAGSIATPFENRGFGAEVALCQRYFQRTNFIRWDNYLAAVGSDSFLSFLLPVQLRASPTVTASGVTTSLTGVVYGNSNNTTLVVNATGGVAGDNIWLANNIDLSAEL